MVHTHSATQRVLGRGVEAGCDEAGRGCLAGPVVAAVVVLPMAYYNPAIRDSKLLSPQQRFKLRKEIELRALAWAVAAVAPRVVDALNVLQASLLAMQMACDKLPLIPDLLLVDGNKPLPAYPYAQQCVIHGDANYINIAAASILAKTHRDAIMERLDKIYPAYQWAKNKGYPTRAHKEALLRLGPTPWHRMSFHPALP